MPNGVVATYGYDDANDLISITYRVGATTLGNLTYTYDAAGRRTGVGGTFARTGLPQPLGSATYNANNQLIQWDAATLLYDLNGNLTYDGTNNYTWDSRNQLASMNALAFQYDAFGRRVTNAAGTQFLYDGANAVRELNTVGIPTANLLTGLGVDEIFTRTDASGARHFLTDALGSTVALSDPAGTLQTQYTYEPFGNTSASGQVSTNSFQYTGRENDGTGLYYYRARYYSPTFQPFVSEDPLGFAGGANLYGYTLNSPTNFTDPSGKIAPAAVAIALCGGGAAVGAYTYHNLQKVNGRKSTFLGYSGSAAAGCGAGVLAGWTLGTALEAVVSAFAPATTGAATAAATYVFYSGPVHKKLQRHGRQQTMGL